MKNNLNLDKNKFRLMLERIEGRQTFNQVNESIKMIITEGIGDDLVRLSRSLVRGMGSSSELMINRIESAISAMSKAIDDYDSAIRNIASGGDFKLLSELLNGKNLRVTMNNFSNAFVDTLGKYFDELNVKVDLIAMKNYISGLTNEIPNDLLRNLNDSQINDLVSVNYLMSQLYRTDFALNKLNKISEMWNKLNKPEDFRSLVLGFVSEDGVKSIDEIEDAIKMLDDLKNGESPKEKELYDIWVRIKSQVGLDVWDGTDFKTLFKKSFSLDPKYKVLESSFLNKLKIWESKNVTLTLDKIKNIDLDWNNTIVFYNKNSNPETVFVLEFKSKKDLENYKEMLKDGNYEFTEAKNKEFGTNAVEELAKRDLRIRNIKIGLFIAVSSAVVIGSTICLLSSDELTPEEIALREKGGGKGAIKEKGIFTKLAICVGEVFQSIKNIGKDIAKTIFEEDILGPMQEFNGYILTEVEKICPKEESGDKQCCMDCNDDDKLKSIIANPEFLVKYESAIRNIDPNILKQKVSGMGVEDPEVIIRQILEQAKNNESVSRYLTKEGKPMSFIEILRMECNKKALPCVEERIKTLWSEIITIVESSDCSSIQNEVNVKIQEMKTYGDAGYLTVDVSDKNKEIPKVYIDIMKRSDIFGSVTTVDEFFITLSNWINRVVVEAKCNTGAESTEVVSVGNVVGEFTMWCTENGKDETKSKSLMEFLWSEGVAQLDCGGGADSIEGMFSPTQERKTMTKYQVFSIFDEYFKPIFPSIDRMDDDWDDAFNYWYDKQKSLCNY
jgi:hypothetical protein